MEKLITNLVQDKVQVKLYQKVFKTQNSYFHTEYLVTVANYEFLLGRLEKSSSITFVDYGISKSPVI